MNDTELKRLVEVESVWAKFRRTSFVADKPGEVLGCVIECHGLSLLLSLEDTRSLLSHLEAAERSSPGLLHPDL